MIEIYTDGSITKNPGGVGGYAWVIVNPDYSEVPISCGGGFETISTNNRAELLGIINGLKQINEPANLYSDSQYCVKCFYNNSWGKNTDLWYLLSDEVSRTNSSLIWQPRRHNIYSKFADDLARSFAFSLPQPTYENIVNNDTRKKEKKLKLNKSKEVVNNSVLDKINIILSYSNDLDINLTNTGYYKLTIGWFDSMKVFSFLSLEETVNNAYNYVINNKN